MQYGQIVFLLFIALLFYYAALIVLDIMKAKAAQTAELESQSEEDIDISDEAKTFKPFRISRDEPKQKEDKPEEKANSDSETKSDREQPESNSEKPFHRPGFREAIMTDGILVEDLVVEVNNMVENGICDLGSLIADCENAK
ncbi:hypothetical protein [Phocaeicola sartorii]|jgi:hypothetical protein|uniref:hypothetical protein n=1 Tax=Phocaeicola sartorii TaxID=671267 RepID=UPI00046A2FB4|nr:hypothetical protein [Phocaeicola sartorii]MCR1844202.1 hypothetical protein [Phocaeicola sartorii]